MTNDFATKLGEYGFAPDTDFYDTTLAFFHEIHNLHHNEEDPALLYESLQVQQQPENLNSLVHCEATCSPTASLDRGIEAILQHWVMQLRYQSPLYENIEVNRSDTAAKISCITVADRVACTFTFVVREHPDYIENEISPEDTQRMLDTMDATFDGPLEEMLEKIKPARPASDNDSRGK